MLWGEEGHLKGQLQGHIAMHIVRQERGKRSK